MKNLSMSHFLSVTPFKSQMIVIWKEKRKSISNFQNNYQRKVLVVFILVSGEIFQLNSTELHFFVVKNFHWHSLNSHMEFKVCA